MGLLYNYADEKSGNTDLTQDIDKKGEKNEKSI